MDRLPDNNKGFPLFGVNLICFDTAIDFNILEFIERKLNVLNTQVGEYSRLGSKSPNRQAHRSINVSSVINIK
jgi:hypothetical protein